MRKIKKVFLINLLNVTKIYREVLGYVMILYLYGAVCLFPKLGTQDDHIIFAAFHISIASI